MVQIISGSKEKYEKMLKEDSKMVKGRFFCHEPKGGSITFPFKKYKEIPRVDYTFEDGKDYEIPLMVAKHINNCGWEVHKHTLDENGVPVVNIGKIVKRFAFQSLDFF